MCRNLAVFVAAPGARSSSPGQAGHKPAARASVGRDWAGRAGAEESQPVSQASEECRQTHARVRSDQPQ